MKTTRIKVRDLKVGDRVMVGYAYDEHDKRIRARLFDAKTTSRERSYWGYATGTVSNIESVRRDRRNRLDTSGKYLRLTFDGVPDSHDFVKWSKATVVTE